MTPRNGDIAALEANGTALTATKNGAAAGSTTDGTLVTGQAGLYAGGTANVEWENFQYEA